jgi:hypothetical protein
MKVICTIIKHRKENKYTVLVLSMMYPLRIKTMEEQRWRVFQRRVIRRTFGSKRQETGRWRKLYIKSSAK